MVFPNTTITKGPHETQALGEAFASVVASHRGSIKKPIIICLHGELGAGKTTFVQGFAKGLGIPSRILSPTFILLRSYPLPHQNGRLYHFDLYRIATISELRTIGFEEIIQEDTAFALIEWPEKAGDQLPAQRFDISFRILSARVHEVIIAKYG